MKIKSHTFDFHGENLNAFFDSLFSAFLNINILSGINFFSNKSGNISPNYKKVNKITKGKDSFKPLKISANTGKFYFLKIQYLRNPK